MGKDKIIGITRVRNEALLIEDTLKHFSGFLDGIVVWDDCSTDSTVDIIRELSNKKVLAVIQSMEWLRHREAEETRHRHILLQVAKTYHPQWIFCFDADERIEGDVRSLVDASAPDIDGYRIGLYDAYLTQKHRAPYKPGAALSNLPRLYGPERRDILMLWRNSENFFMRATICASRATIPRLTWPYPPCDVGILAKASRLSSGKPHATTMRSISENRTARSGRLDAGRRFIPKATLVARCILGTMYKVDVG